MRKTECGWTRQTTLLIDSIHYRNTAGNGQVLMTHVMTMSLLGAPSKSTSTLIVLDARSLVPAVCSLTVRLPVKRIGRGVKGEDYAATMMPGWSLTLLC